MKRSAGSPVLHSLSTICGLRGSRWDGLMVLVKPQLPVWRYVQQGCLAGTYAPSVGVSAAIRRHTDQSR